MQNIGALHYTKYESKPPEATTIAPRVLMNSVYKYQNERYRSSICLTFI